MIGDLATSGALPALEAMLRFSGQRHQLITSNIANLTTPGYQPRDVSPGAFREALGDAINARREQTGGQRGALEMRDSREVKQGPDGGYVLRPETPSGNVLFHDRNDRDLERTMQSLVENASVFRAASQFIQKHQQMMRIAISERV